jgi:ubiquinone/menaquinone biosynthesis C-methylase UbiE
MDKVGSQLPLVSITLPLAKDADPDLLRICLDSISTQTYPHFETLVLIAEGAGHELSLLASSYPFVDLFEGTYNKSAARNFLIKKAKGKFVLILDVDMQMLPSLLQICVNKYLTDNAEAIIVPHQEAPARNFWRRCRSLEWELLAGDLYAETPNFILKNLLEVAGGFDPSFDPLDDWQLNLAFRNKGIRFERADTFILVRSSSSLKEIMRRKFLRGQMIPALNERYPDIPQIRFNRRFIDAYLRNWRLLLKSPILSLGLIFLKMLDLTALSWGRLHPPRDNFTDGTKPYFHSDVAHQYDQIRLGDNFNRYKHYSETTSLIELINNSDEMILEVGCGTGRITHELVGIGFDILPVDPSPPMLEQFRKKPNLPNPITADGIALPFGEASFESVYSLRVIWHLSTLQQIEQMLIELARVTHSFLILDITNKQRWQNPVIRFFIRIYFSIRSHEHQAHLSSHLFSFSQFSEMTEAVNLYIDKILPLDVLSPVWLKLLPTRIALSLFRYIFYIEKHLWKIIPPGRFIIRLTKIDPER